MALQMAIKMFMKATEEDEAVHLESALKFYQSGIAYLNLSVELKLYDDQTELISEKIKIYKERAGKIQTLLQNADGDYNVQDDAKKVKKWCFF